ncbi:MAG: hypothetical protein AB7G93_20655 [Bdellovibrionales bacterium]
MKFESFLHYVTHHSESLIQWLFFAILLLSGGLIARGLFGKSDEEPSSKSLDVEAASLHGEIQGVLHKILEQTAKLESVNLAEATPQMVADVDAQVQTLKKNLAAREQELAVFKQDGGSAAGAQVDELQGRIKELEGKLAEYEILEDDIADLSLYKEENTRLRTELEKYKGGGAAPSAPAPAAAVEATDSEVSADALAAELGAEPAPESEADFESQAEVPPESGSGARSGEDIVAEFAEAVSQETASDPASEVPFDARQSDNPMEAFEAALQMEKAPQEPVSLGVDPGPASTPIPTPAPTAPSPAPLPSNLGSAADPDLAKIADMLSQADAQTAVTPAPAPAPAPESPAPVFTLTSAPASVKESAQASSSASAPEADDLFAEFAQAQTEIADDASSVTLDTDKMMAEMAALVGVEPTSDNALDESIDTNKMAAEASSLGKSS